MYNITLICTRHQEIGNCNSRELCRIIEEYRPEVIFEELSPVIYNECYSLSSFGISKRVTLETDAIKMYQQYQSVKHIPVLSAQLHEDFHRMHHKIQDYHYGVLTENLISLERIYGFPFLNSAQSEELFENIKTLEKRILKDDYEIFLRAYECVDLYENDMIKNVYQYSSENNYDKAIMFIGAAHRKSIIQKIQVHERASNLKLNWTFYGNLNN